MVLVNALRAAADAKFTVYIFILTLPWPFRLKILRGQIDDDGRLIRRGEEYVLLGKSKSGLV
jgi:hypothetical protein